MDDLETLTAILFSAGLLLCLFAIYIAHEVKKGPPKKPNVRVPRETLWTRTNDYHEACRRREAQRDF